MNHKNILRIILYHICNQKSLHCLSCWNCLKRYVSAWTVGSNNVGHQLGWLPALCFWGDFLHSHFFINIKVNDKSVMLVAHKKQVYISKKYLANQIFPAILGRIWFPSLTNIKLFVLPWKGFVIHQINQCKFTFDAWYLLKKILASPYGFTNCWYNVQWQRGDSNRLKIPVTLIWGFGISSL